MNVWEDSRVIAMKEFAFTRHREIGHVRKYTGECYTVHLQQVADILIEHGDCETDTIMIALGHDLFEDTLASSNAVRKLFGSNVANGIGLLTDFAYTSTRKVRHSIYMRQMCEASENIRRIKLADIVSNASGIRKYDPKFAAVWVSEKMDMMRVLQNCGNAYRSLYERALAALTE